MASAAQPRSAQEGAMHYETGPAAAADDEWPHEMQISVDYPSNLLTLLFIRQSWQLQTMTQLPELLLAPQPGTSVAPSGASLEEWSRRWDRAWGQASAEPERMSLPSLRTAWSGGLDSIIVLPFAENWTRRLDKRHLAVSTTTRNAASSYSAALSLPIPNN